MHCLCTFIPAVFSVAHEWKSLFCLSMRETLMEWKNGFWCMCVYNLCASGWVNGPGQCIPFTYPKECGSDGKNWSLEGFQDFMPCARSDTEVCVRDGSWKEVACFLCRSPCSDMVEMFGMERAGVCHTEETKSYHSNPFKRANFTSYHFYLHTLPVKV